MRSVESLGDRVLVRSGQGAEIFDAAVLAAHSDQALAIIHDPTPLEREVLSAIPYQRNEAVVHTDRSVLPRRRLAWASWNYFRAADSGRSASLTYNLNVLQHLKSPEPICVTLNPLRPARPDKVIERLSFCASCVQRRGVRRAGQGGGAEHEGQPLLLRRLDRLGFSRGRAGERPQGGGRGARMGGAATESGKIHLCTARSTKAGSGISGTSRLGTHFSTACFMAYVRSGRAGSNFCRKMVSGPRSAPALARFCAGDHLDGEAGNLAEGVRAAGFASAAA